MIPRDAAALLRHRPPALLLGEIAAFGGTTIECTSRGDGPWRWAQLLEGAAQAAGLLAGLRAGGPDRRAVIAEFRDVAVLAPAHAGPVRFAATLDRRLLGCWRCRVVVHGDDGRPVLTARITVAPAAAPPGEPWSPSASPPDVRVPPADERALAQLAAEGFGDLFDRRQHEACWLVERYALDLACAIAATLDLPAWLATPQQPEAIMAACGFAPAFAAPLGWLLDVLALRGVLVREPAGYRQVAPLPASALEAVRAAGLAADPSYEPAYALLDEAAALYPRVARGEVVAERALFLRVRLWQAYFSNSNRYYALGNRVAARTAAARLADAGGGAVLEVGAGLGSAAEALFEALRARKATALVERYLLTEPVPFFRRRAGQALARDWPGIPIVPGSFDLNQPWTAQEGVAAGGFALVWGVNVFHLARDLDGVLAAARAALRPGGWLVAGEGLRPRPLEPVAAELPFRLLASFADVALDPERRPTPGFLTGAAWCAALTRAGFEAVHLVPDAERLQAFCPVFLGAAACGRRRAA